MFLCGDVVKLSAKGRKRYQNLPNHPHHELGMVTEVVYNRRSANQIVMVAWPNGAAFYGSVSLRHTKEVPSVQFFL